MTTFAVTTRDVVESDQQPQWETNWESRGIDIQSIESSTEILCLPSHNHYDNSNKHRRKILHLAYVKAGRLASSSSRSIIDEVGPLKVGRCRRRQQQKWYFNSSRRR